MHLLWHVTAINLHTNYSEAYKPFERTYKSQG